MQVGLPSRPYAIGNPGSCSQKEGESDTKNPFQTKNQEETRQLPDVDVLFFDINLRTHMGVFI
ncbi:rCG49356, partial [Rattus norvegicus]